MAPGGEVRAEDIVLKHGPGFTKHLLVVDDEPNMRNFLSDALASEHYTVDSAQDGEEAWRKLQTRPYDCILLDLKMPKMSGQQLYRLIAEHDEEQAKKVIFITGDVIGAETSAFISATGNPALLKPFNLDELRKQILHVQSTTRAVDAQATTGEGDS